MFDKGCVEYRAAGQNDGFIEECRACLKGVHRLVVEWHVKTTNTWNGLNSRNHG